MTSEGTPKAQSKRGDDSLVMAHLSERRKEIKDCKNHQKKMSQ